MTADEERVIGFLILHPNSKLPYICTELRLDVRETDDVLRKLINDGVVSGRGYASHVEEYYVLGGNNMLSPQKLGALYLKYKTNQENV